MGTEYYLNELLTKIDRLSHDIEKNRQEISLLKAAVIKLKNNGQSSLNESDVKESPTKPFLPGLENFIGLKLIHFVGIIVLIIGLTIGVKYAIDINLVSPGMRIALTYLAGAALFITSLKLRKKYELFSIILFSGSMASVYFTTYAAFEYYALLSRLPAFVLMFFFTFYTVYNSLKYKRQEIAILGLVGAYGIPFFVRGHTDNILALFSYIFLINIGVLIISFKKYWLSLTYISFLTTWGIFLSWLVMHTGNNHFNTEALFCFPFFILFLLNCLVFKTLKRQNITFSDTLVVVADTIFLYFTLILQYKNNGMLSMENITLVFALTYLLAALAGKKYLPTQEYFNNALFSISLTALVAFVEMQFAGFKVTIIWVVMAVILFIIGMLYRMKVFRIVSILLFTATLVKLLFVDSIDFSSIEKVIAYIFTGTVLLVVSFLYQKFKKSIFNETES